jgi:hypothetical protein
VAAPEGEIPVPSLYFDRNFELECLHTGNIGDFGLFRRGGQPEKRRVLLEENQGSDCR